MFKRREINPLIWQWTFDQAEWDLAPASRRADSVLAWALKQYPESAHLSRSQIQSLIRSEKITRNGKPLRNSDVLGLNETVEIEIPELRTLELRAESHNIPILFEDEHLVVIDKPKGMSVHPSQQEIKGTLVNALLHQIKNLSGIGGILRPGIVHRLDKYTSGVMVVSKHDESHRQLSALFAKHALTRKYWALCFGCPRQQEGRIETLIGRSPKDRKLMSAHVTKGRKAVTYYKVLERYGTKGKAPFASWVELTLETGRTHQVRVHMTTLGCSILGDTLYGVPSDGQGKWKSIPTTLKTQIESLKGQTLHARLLSLVHPITSQTLEFTSAPPPDFISMSEALRHYRC